MEVGKIYESPARAFAVSSSASAGFSVAKIQSVDKYVHVPLPNSDSVEISEEAKDKYQIASNMSGKESAKTEDNNSTENIENSKNKTNVIHQNKSKSDNTNELTDEQKQAVADLKARDAEVRAHEQAHLSASGGLARGGASFSYQTGPDGQKYAIGGEVSIDISSESDPQQTISKMSQVRRAALAPADPSAQDRAIANQASQISDQARSELNSGFVSSEGSTGSKSSNNVATQLSSNNSQSNSGDVGARIISAMGGPGSLTTLKSNNTDDLILSKNFAKVYTQNDSKVSTILKTFA